VAVEDPLPPFGGAGERSQEHQAKSGSGRAVSKVQTVGPDPPSALMISSLSSTSPELASPPPPPLRSSSLNSGSLTGGI